MRPKYLALGPRDQARRSAAEAFEIFTALDDMWRIANLKERLRGPGAMAIAAPMFAPPKAGQRCLVVLD
jgi:hypothetical protein